MKPETASATKREPGRPEAMTEGRRVQVYLDAKTIEEARKLGDGNLSNGIRRALEQVASNNPA